MLSSPVKDGTTVLEELTGQRKEEAEDDDMDWDEEILGEMEGGYDNRRFSSYWNSDNNMTYPLILAKIPVKNPWEIFAYLPFGGWNECPNTPELMAVAKYWFEQYGAVPAVMTHDELEFLLPVPVSEKEAVDKIKKIDRERRLYYEGRTDRKWGSIEANAILLNSSLLGIDGAVDALEAIYHKWENR